MSDAAALEAALAATLAALEAGDPLAAAEASAEAARACAALESAGVPLEAAQLGRLSAVQAHCLSSADRVMRRLGEELSVTARTTRAGAAYRR
jgi:hypothetical protein